VWMNSECWNEANFACVKNKSSTEPVKKCDGGVRKEGEIVYSPGFPSDASVPCDVFLQAVPGKRVEVEILALEANSCCDKLVLAEGTLGGETIVELTGASAVGRKFNTTSSNYMRFSWQPKGGVNVQGAKITFRSV
ncbi:hypothetical protein PFISCL1PPCAC_9788, partial [Pristionchus fissidentatus]